MTENKKLLVAGIGELLWDMLPSGKRAGGAPVNFVYNTARLGAEGYAVSAVGRDRLGAEILEELRRHGIDYCIEEVAYPTGTVQVKLHDGMPSYEIVENVAWDHLSVTPQAAAIISRADAVCFGTLASRFEETRRTIAALLAMAPAQALKFYDINLRKGYYSRELIAALLQQANAFKINDEEMLVFRELFGYSGSDEDICLKLIREYKLRYVVFTAGEKYSIIYDGREKSYLETPKVKVVDTVGAGDAFSGTFIYHILSGKPLAEAHAAAVERAARVCEQAGAW